MNDVSFYHINIFNKIMCEASENYLWDLGDKVGSGATSNVYKAYNITTGEIVAAKVSKITSVLYNISSAHKTDAEKKSDSRSIFDREINFLKNVNNDNIVRFIGTEIVILSDDSYALPNREVLFIEYCNGGSVGDMLRLPANRYGLSEDIIMQIMKDVTNALKYLHRQNIIHRDIKPDNIMQSIDINGKVTFKLTDLGVARQINPGEQTSDSIRGTVEYIHPVVYCEYFPDIKVNIDGKTVRTRPQFPFEVEMWSFGVTLYQCSTGRIPFQPYDGVRDDRNTMREILTSIPIGYISGIQYTYNGEIQWSKILPEWCRLSSNLKKLLEKLLSRLFETNKDRLMSHEEFFDEIDKIINLIPIYYLNLKRFTLTCSYFQIDDSINTLFDQIRQENDDEINVDYYCLFQNVHYPISKTERISIETFYKQLPILPSCEKPLVIYTFSSLKFDQKCVPKVDIPEVQPLKNIRDVFSSVYEWSKNIVGLFFYLKNQLIEYEYIMKITQSSIVTIHRFLKSKLFQLLCSIRKELFDHQALHELERIIDLIESKNNSISVVDQSLIDINNDEQSSTKTIRPYHKSIIKSCHIDDTSSQQTTSSEHQSLSRIRPMLRSSSNFYHKLIEYEKELSIITNKNFSDQLKMVDDCHLIFNTSYHSKQINNYSLHIRRIDKYVKDAIDLSDRFRRDTTINRSSSLQMTSHILRQKLLKELHDKYLHFVNEGCYPLILEIFTEYRKWIKQQADINHELRRIQFSYEDQYRTNIPINDLRQIINDELQKMGAIDISLLPDNSSLIHSEHNSEIHQDQELTTVKADENSSHSNNINDSNKIVVNKIHVTLQETIKQAKNNSNMLDDMIKQLHQKIKTHTLI